ncbi:MAG: PepSY domain-containing protein [Saccharofermentanales bacterium]
MQTLNRTKTIWIAAAATLLLLVCLSVFWGVRADALFKAKASSSPYLPDTAKFVSSHFVVDRYVLHYFDTLNLERIEIEVLKSSWKVIKLQVQKANYEPSGRVRLSDAVLLEKFENAQVDGHPAKNIRISRSSDLDFAEITYAATDSRGFYLLDPADGTLISYTVKFGSPIVIPYSSDVSSFRILSLSELKRIADLEVPGAIFQDLDVVYSNEIFIAEIDLYNAGMKHILLFDAVTGKMIRHKSYKDYWQNYGSWEPVELVSPLINITNLDASLTLPDSGSSYSSGQYSSAAFISSVSGEAGNSSTGSAASTSVASGPYSGTSAYSMVTSVSLLSQIPDASPTPRPTITASPTGPSIISIARVKELVLSRLPGASFDGAIDLDSDDERLLYEGEAVDGTTRVSFEIDAYTGIFANWELDEIDDD